MIRIIVHGSNSIVVAGLVSILNEHANLQAIASSVARASLISLMDCQADLLLLERSPDEDWWLDRAISLTDFELSGILLTDSITSEEINEFIALGFRGFLPRLSSTTETIIAIEAVMAGLIVIHPELASFRERDSAIAPLPPSEIPLTSREVEVLQLLAAGLDNKAIALKLNISKHTVKFHISSILAKLNVSSRTEAVTLGLRQGLILL